MIYLIKKYWKYIFIFTCVTMTFIGTYFYHENNKISTNSVKKLAVTKKEKEKISNTVFVDVKGAVNAPGVYELDEGRRVIDAINLAGGLSDNANTINLNLSKKLTDEMYIVVYTKNEIAEYKKSNDNSKITCASNECVCPDAKNDACIKKDKKAPNLKTDDNVKLDTKVSINNATKEELMTLSKIGDAKAAAIISYRQEHGNFNTLEDIKNVSGIGDSIYEAIKENITL